MSSTRQLAAILFTDIAGYTAMMQENETAALAVVRHYMSVLDEVIAQHRGTILNNYGDGHLCTFTSATEAVRCAMDLQRALQSKPKVPLRVGLHIGEVIFEDRKPFGDGVNVASRIQSLGVANSILLSAEIHSKINNQPEFKTISLGGFHFKNVNTPMEVFALTNEGLVVPERENMEGKVEPNASAELSGWSRKGKRSLPVALLVLLVLAALVYSNYDKWLPETEIKSIAILPFENLSPNQEDQFLADGFHEEIISRLNRQNDLLVIDRRSSDLLASKGLTESEISTQLNARYILKGSLRREGDNIRLTTHLTDVRSNVVINTKTINRKLTEYLPLQTEVATRVVADIGMTVSKGVSSFPTSNSLTAYEYYRRALKYPTNTIDTARSWDFIRLMTRATQEDSMFVSAWHALLAHNLFRYRNSGDSTDLIRALEAKKRIESIDPDGYAARSAELLYVYGVSRDFRLVIKKAEELLELLPNSSQALSMKALAHRRLGEDQTFVNLFLKLIRSNPLDDEPRVELSSTLIKNGQVSEARKYYGNLKETRHRTTWYIFEFNSRILENRLDELVILFHEARRDSARPVTRRVLHDIGKLAISLNQLYNRKYDSLLATPWNSMDCFDSAMLYRLKGDTVLSNNHFEKVREKYSTLARKDDHPETRALFEMIHAIALAALGKPEWQAVMASAYDSTTPFNYPYYFRCQVVALLMAKRNHDAFQKLKEWTVLNVPLNLRVGPNEPFQLLLKQHPLLDPIRSEPGFEELWEGNHLRLKPLKLSED
jgi:TolB-like protein/class 3 adenylate cyclase